MNREKLVKLGRQGNRDVSVAVLQGGPFSLRRALELAEQVIQSGSGQEVRPVRGRAGEG
jgi:hypothetical protein